MARSRRPRPAPIARAELLEWAMARHLPRSPELFIAAARLGVSVPTLHCRRRA